jgi:MFS transporter, FSR family, fosmidomycin resistance protein
MMSQETPHKARILSISLAHLLNDWYMNYIQTLLPFLIAAGMPVSRGAFLVSAFTITSSMLQPVSGYLVDQKNQRWLVYAGTLWMAVLLSLVGVLQNYALLILAVSLAGLGTAAFHPQASAMVTAMSGRRKGFSQAFFITFGNIGWALTPLVVVPFTLKYGMESTLLFALPGMLVALLLWFTAPNVTSETPRVPPPHLWTTIRSVWTELSKVVLVVSVRSLTTVSLVAFLPLYLQHKNIPLVHGSRMLSLMLFMGALGGLLGGHLSDRFGRKSVIVGSLILTGPLFHLFLGASEPLSYFLLAGAGAALAASFSVTVVVAQEVIPKNAAMATGLMLGFGMGVGGLGVGLMGLMVEYAGIERAIHLLIWLPLPAGIIGLSLRSDAAAIKEITD